MQALLLHLSDIHIQAEDDLIISRCDSIFNAIKNIISEHGVNIVACVITGDIAFSGTDDQYMIASEMLSELKNKVCGYVRDVEFHFILTPGNHDCDFSINQEIREMVIENLVRDSHRLDEELMLNECLKVQQNYINFQNSIIEKSHVTEGHAYYEYKIYKDSECISFLSINTAATSKLHESPGILQFPFSKLPNDRSECSVAISIFHHPTHWLTPQCKREFESKIEKISDIVLTGHEHMADHRAIISKSGNFQYIEGSALQDTNKNEASGFGLILINTNTKKMKKYVFKLAADIYTHSNTQISEIPWEDFKENNKRLNTIFNLKKDFEKYLDDIEINITHRIKEKVFLSDLYIFPDLKKYCRLGENNKKIIRSDQEIIELLNETHSLCIFGEDQSGKTALAKIFFLHFRSLGDVPILIDVSKKKLAPNNVGRHINSAFKENYLEQAKMHYDQLDRAKKVIIIDNYDKANMNEVDFENILIELKKYALRIIVFINDLSLSIHLNQPIGREIQLAGHSPFEFYGIRQFGYKKQNKFIEKWMLLAQNFDGDNQFLRMVEQTRLLISATFGKNFVPAYPPYILAILQSLEAATPLELTESTHGFFYGIFIRQAIASYISPLNNPGSTINPNIITSYLSNLAYAFFENKCASLLETDFKKIHDVLKNEYEVVKDFQSTVKMLISMKMIVKITDSYKFYQKYIYYYFVSLYISNHLHEDTVLAGTQQLIQNLHTEDNANIILFLAHHTKDKRILDSLLYVCKNQYTASQVASLSKEEVEFLNSSIPEEESRELFDGNIKEIRENELTRLDNQKEEVDELESTYEADIENYNTQLGKLNCALKTIQILGQFIKNFPMDLYKKDKDEILTNCLLLARRTLGDYFGLIKSCQTEEIDIICHLISQQKPNCTKSELKSLANNAIISLAELTAFGIINRLSYSLGSSDLTDTYDRFFETLNDNFSKLTYIAIKLNHYNDFPQKLILDQNKEYKNAKNLFAFRILQDVVIRHFNLYPVDLSAKHEVCTWLDIKPKSIEYAYSVDRLVKK